MLSTQVEIPYNGQSFFIDVAEGKMIHLNKIYEIAGNPEGKFDPRQWGRKPREVKSGSSGNISINGGPGFDFIDFAAKNLNVAAEHIYKTTRGKHGGTWAHWQIGLAYAKYLSPELHLAVNQVFKERLEETINPELGINRSRERARKSWDKQGHDKEWIDEREKHIDTRKFYVDTLLDHDVKPGGEVGHCTNKIYKGIFNKDKTEIEQGIRAKKPGLPQKINIRDHAKRSSLAAIGLAEALASEEIDEHDIRGISDCAKTSFDKGLSVRLALNDSRSKAPKKPQPKTVDEASYRQGIASLRAALKR
jgi:hypothetical protein